MPGFKPPSNSLVAGPSRPTRFRSTAAPKAWSNNNINVAKAPNEANKTSIVTDFADIVSKGKVLQENLDNELINSILATAYWRKKCKALEEENGNLQLLLLEKSKEVTAKDIQLRQAKSLFDENQLAKREAEVEVTQLQTQMNTLRNFMLVKEGSINCEIKEDIKIVENRIFGNPNKENNITRNNQDARRVAIRNSIDQSIQENGSYFQSRSAEIELVKCDNSAAKSALKNLRMNQKDDLWSSLDISPVKKCNETFTITRTPESEKDISIQQHVFQTKYVKSVIDKCCSCTKRLKFGKPFLECKACKATCHKECQLQIPYKCANFYKDISKMQKGNQQGVKEWNLRKQSKNQQLTSTPTCQNTSSRRKRQNSKILGNLPKKQCTPANSIFKSKDSKTRMMR